MSFTIEESRPPTAAVELGCTLVQWCVAASTSIDTLLHMLVEFTSSSRLCTLFSEHSKLLITSDQYK